MADQLITGTTLVEKESRSIGDVPIGGLIEWDEVESGVPNLPEGYVKASGQVIVDALSPLNGQTIGDYNTFYYSISGHKFVWSTSNNTGNFTYYNADGANAGHNTMVGFASIELPEGAIITEAIVYGSDTGKSWHLVMNDLAANPTQTAMATAVLGTADTTIASATIDNTTNTYHLDVGEGVTIEQNDTITGARIKYSSPLNKQIIMRIR